MDPLPPNPQAHSIDSGQKVTKPITAWWWIIPTGAFVAVEIVLGGTPAMGRTSAPGSALGLIVGGIIGGLLISLLISLVAAWVAHLTGNRWERAATITYSVVMCIVCVGVVMDSQRREAARLSAVPVMTSFGDIRFEVPANWRKAKPVLPQSLALIVLNGDLNARSEPHGMIQVDFGKSSLTARQIAQTAAGSDGHVLSDPVSIDGVEGIRAETASTEMTRPRIVVVVIRGEKGYLIMAAAENGADVSGALEHIIKTWRWNDAP